MRTRRQTYSQQAVKRRKTMKQEKRNWLDLPRDVLILIFMKLGVFDLLINAQRVCSLWRQVSREPILFRSLDFVGAKNYVRKESHFVRLAMQALLRARPQVIKLSFNDYRITKVLRYGYACSMFISLKSFQLGPTACTTEYELAHFCQGLPSLEECDLTFLLFPETIDSRDWAYLSEVDELSLNQEEL
ncbi:hypothetical protein ACHQM5_024979 [Ranunculus cassubicifolius]